MYRGLSHATHTPLQRLGDEPPVQGIAINRPSTGLLVRPHELIDGSHATDLEWRPEPPRLHAQPTEILERVADMDELPVDDSRQSVVVDDDVAETEVAVSPRRRRPRWPVGGEPLLCLLERRAVIIEHAIRVPVLREAVDLD